MFAATATIVNDDAANQPPSATNLSAPETYIEDTPLNLVDIVTSDIDSATVTATLTLLNPSAGSLNTGTSGTVTSTYVAGTGTWTASGAIANVNTLLAGLTFTPAANGNASFTITTSVSDGSLSVSGSKAVTGTPVNDPPSATNLSAPETYIEDTPLNLVDIVTSDIDSATVTATLTLSSPAAGSLNTATSGTVTSTYVAGTGVWTASGAIANVNTLLAGLTFTPAANGSASFTIATSVSDGSLAVSGSKAVTGTPVNDAPVVTVSGDFSPADEGEIRVYTYSATDVDSASLIVTETCSGDAAYISDLVDDSFSCRLVDGSGLATVNVTANDSTPPNNIGDDSHMVTVNNVAPTGILGNNGPVNEGSPVTVSFSAQSDPSSTDTTAGFHYAYDCANGSLAGATYTGSGTTASTTCTFADGPATRTVKARIIDKDGGYTEYTTDVTVNNAAPTVTPPDVDAPENQGALEGSIQSFAIGSFIDAGTSDGPWAVQVDWGDGSLVSAFNQSTQGSLGTVSHTYEDDAVYLVTVDVTDKDTANGGATFNVTVSNVAPVATLGDDGPVDEGTSFHLDLTSPFDPSPVDTTAGFTYAFDCGDGAGYGIFNTSASATCPTDDNGVRAVGAKIRDKDGGTTTYTSSVTVNNVAPVVSNLAGDATVNESGVTQHTYTYDIFDPGVLDTQTATPSCGTGGHLVTGSDSNTATGGTFKCTFPDGPASPIVTVSATDSDGDTGNTASLPVTVNNVAPTGILGNNGPVNEGSPVGELQRPVGSVLDGHHGRLPLRL